ncbi:hypothetical protein [Cupriavidus respiraculi]
MDAVCAWRDRAGSRETVAIEIVAAHRKLGLDRLPKLAFETAGDHFTLAKNAADRIFRWLDDKSKDTNFMPANFEDSILAAMPRDLLIAYENERLAKFGLCVRGVDGSDGSGLNATQHLIAIAKETAEAQTAVANLIDGATASELHTADRELAEAEETIRRARADVAAAAARATGLKAVA